MADANRVGSRLHIWRFFVIATEPMGLPAYRIFLFLYRLAAWLITPVNAKAAKWLAGRRNWRAQMRSKLSGERRSRIWMHVASVGEYEQGRPLLEKLKLLYPDHAFLVTFFSPSGYDAVQQDGLPDHVFYLPHDSPRNAKDFLDIVKPELALFIKYEFWYYFLRTVSQRNIPLVLASAIFRADQPFFRFYGGLYRRMLRFYRRIFVQNESSRDLLQRIGVLSEVSGDTRFDRVLELAAGNSAIAGIEDFCSGCPVLVAGSTWDDDDEELDHFANSRPGTRFMIAPHVVDRERIDECLSYYKHAVPYSAWLKGERPANCNTLIIDRIGLLSRLYRYADVCLIGGGFGGGGVHNTLEAAVFGKPLVFGPVFDEYVEAVALEEMGAAFCVEDALQLESTLDLLFRDTALRSEAGKKAGNYVRTNAGASDRIVRFIQENLLLTN